MWPLTVDILNTISNRDCFADCSLDLTLIVSFWKIGFLVCRWKQIITLPQSWNWTHLQFSTQCSNGCQCVLCNFQWFLFSIMSVTVLYLGGRFFFGTHCSYSTLDPVSAWKADRLWTGKPPRRRTRHPGLLSLSLPSVIRLEWVLGGSCGVNRHIAWYTSPYPRTRSVLGCLVGGLACGDQRRRTGSGGALEALRDDALYKYTFTFLYQVLSTMH